MQLFEYRILVIYLLLCNSVSSIAQVESFGGYAQTNFKIDPTSNISEEVLTINYDKNGYAWVLAISGLYRYDNKELINFNNLAHDTKFIEWGRLAEDPIFFDNNKLIFLFVGNKYRYVIVNVDDYTIKEGDFMSMGLLNHRNNLKLTKTVDGTLRAIKKVGDHVVELCRVDFDNHKLIPIKQYQFKERINYITDVFLTSQVENHIILHTQDKLISSDSSYNDILSSVNTCLYNQELTSLVSFDSHNNTIYYSSGTCRGINTLNLKTQKIAKVGGLPDKQFHTHFQDHQGNNLFLIKRNLRSTDRVFITTSDSLLKDFSSSLEIDENTTCYASIDFSKSISVATYNGFYNFHKIKTNPFENYLVGDKKGTRFGITIRGVSAISDTSYLIGREINKLYIYDSKSQSISDFQMHDSQTKMPILNFNCCYDLSPRIDSFIYTVVCNNVTLSGSQGSRILKINVYTGEVTALPFPNTGSDILYDGDSTLYISSNYQRGMTSNILLYNIYTNEVTDFYEKIDLQNSYTLPHIRNIKIDKDGNYWLGTDSGLRQVNPERTSYFDHIFEFSVDPHTSTPDILEMCYLEDQNILAIATSTIGVVLYDIDNKTSILISTRTGLLSNTIYNLSQNKDYIYIGSEVGLSVYNLEMNRVLYTFKNDDGLTDNEFNRNSSFIHNGLGFFGTVNGLNIVELDKLTAHKSGLDILIDKLYVRDIDERIIQTFYNIKSNQLIKIKK